MTDRRRQRSLKLLAGQATCAAIWLVMLLQGTGPLDRRTYEALYAGERPSLIALARVLTSLGEPTTLVAASILFALGLWFCGRGRAGATLLLVTLLGRGLTEVQKIIVARPRPLFEVHLVTVRTQSFPSGHAASSMIFYVALALLLVDPSRWKTLILAASIFMSLLIGISRIMLGVHWPSDVIGGWAFGAWWVLVALRPAQRLLKSESERA